MSTITQTERNSEILRRYEAGEMVEDIAEEYGISRKRVYAIVNITRRRGALTTRVVNVLDRLGIAPSDIDAIAALSEDRVRKEPGMGEISFNTLRAYLQSHGRNFGEKPAPADPDIALQEAASRYYEAIRARDEAFEAVDVAHAEWHRLKRESLAKWLRVEQAATKKGDNQ